jgi:hypothetical protein
LRVRHTLRELARWRPPEPIPDREGVDEDGRRYTRAAIQFYDLPKPVVLGFWVALYWLLRRQLGRVLGP